MKKNSALKILGTVFCLILSLFFIVTAVIVPFYYSITALTVPETIALVVQNVDYETVIEQNPNIKSTLQEFGIDSSEADKYMKSAQAKELIEIYADEVTEIFLNIPNDRMLDVSLIKEIVDDNIDDFIAIAEDNTGLELSEKLIGNEVDTFFKENKTEIEAAVPAIEETRTIVKTIMASTIIERKLTLNSALIIIAVVAVVLAMICLIKRSAGFLWIGIDFTFISIILSLIIIFSRSYVVNKVALKFSKFETEIIESAISICTEKIILALYSVGILAIIFIMFFIVIVLVKRKYKNMNLNETNSTIGHNTGDGSMSLQNTN